MPAKFWVAVRFAKYVFRWEVSGPAIWALQAGLLHGPGVAYQHVEMERKDKVCKSWVTTIYRGTVHLLKDKNPHGKLGVMSHEVMIAFTCPVFLKKKLLELAHHYNWCNRMGPYILETSRGTYFGTFFERGLILPPSFWAQCPWQRNIESPAINWRRFTLSVGVTQRTNFLLFAKPISSPA